MTEPISNSSAPAGEAAASEATDASIFDTIDPTLKVVSVDAVIAAPASEIFELIADPVRQPEWDGNDNLAKAAQGQRVAGAGSSFITTLTKGIDRENHVVDFEEGRLIAWKPSEVGGEPFGQKWTWEIEATGESSSVVRQTYDWTELRDPRRLPRAQSTTSENLLESLNRLKALAES
ncbi:MAG: SRPBCC family protein [Brevibacterium sp.]|uniref:SRPBCC family protein n=1 Tax=Brevibacterium TaxID=1696 RepID=UPI000BB85277|nr:MULTISPECIES: SRPBCC family protein [Brevibacterium]MDN5585756.1 SRPBCC family protein [Brevibacterium sp.]MDN5657891.1 SRPBCC family protein [Brevibacterium sandarakinum]PCC56533.1 polyketide cyclase [Brevibacterium aurantiacum]